MSHPVLFLCRFSALLFASACGVSFATAQTTFDFTTSSANWTAATGTDSWIRDNTGWHVAGATLLGYTLTSPKLIVGSEGQVTFAVTHVFNFESTGDGGQFQYSTDGGSTWQTIAQDLIAGQTYSASPIQQSYGNPIAGEYAFTGTSSGWSNTILSNATLGTGSAPYSNGSASTFAAGAEIYFRLQGAWDDGVFEASPNWLVTSISVTNASAVPEPTAAAACFGVFALGAAVCLRRRSRKSVAA